MGFSRKRGRPKSIRIDRDKGTKELNKKRSIGVTSELIDLCLTQDLITKEEHMAGVRLRWLFTVSFGAPGISAYFPYEFIDSSSDKHDETWKKQRYAEYEGAVSELEKCGAKKLVSNICIYNQVPEFLYKNYKHQELVKFREGLNILCKVFGYKNSRVGYI